MDLQQRVWRSGSALSNENIVQATNVSHIHTFIFSTHIKKLDMNFNYVFNLIIQNLVILTCHQHNY